MLYSLIIKILFITSYFTMCFPLPYIPHPCDFLNQLIIACYLLLKKLRMDDLRYKLKSLLQTSCHRAFMALWGGYFGLSQQKYEVVWMRCGSSWLCSGGTEFWRCCASTAMCTCQLLPCCKTSPHESPCPALSLALPWAARSAAPAQSKHW